MTTGTYGNESIWNTDQDVYNNIIMGMKKKAIVELDDWNLVECYWTLRGLWRELDAKFETERPDLKNDVDQLEAMRSAYESGEDNKSEFWTSLEDFYLKLCRLMKEHKIYFREATDQRRAVYNT